MGVRVMLGDLRKVDDVIKSLKTETKDYRDFHLKDPRSFKMGVTAKGEYTAEVEGKTLAVMPSAYGSLCKMFKMDGDYFHHYPRKEEFAEHVNTLLKTRKQGVLIRSVGEKLRAVLPSDFTILDDDNFFESFADRIKALPEFLGIQTVGDPSFGFSQYRMIFGQPASKGALKDTRVMLQYQNSEIGAYPLRITGGTFTFHCSNGLVSLDDDFGHWSWKHTGGRDKAIEKIRAAIGACNENIPGLLIPIQNAEKAKLLKPMSDLLKEMVNAEVFPGKLARKMTNFAKERNERPETELDVMQVMTDVAQSFPNSRRTRYEGLALEITRKGWQRTLQEAISRAPKTKPVTRN